MSRTRRRERSTSASGCTAPTPIPLTGLIGSHPLGALAAFGLLSPVLAGLVQDPAAWRWSSYRGTAGLAPETPLLDLSAVAGGKWESRVAFTSSINILSSVSRPIGSIDTVDLSSGFSSPVLASNVEVTAP